MSEYLAHIDGPAEPYGLSIDGDGNPLAEPSGSASDEVRRMVFAFDDHGRQQEVRRIADRVKALEDALRGMRDYYRQHMISGTLYKQVEAALGEPNDQALAQPGRKETL